MTTLSQIYVDLEAKTKGFVSKMIDQLYDSMTQFKPAADARILAVANKLNSTNFLQ